MLISILGNAQTEEEQFKIDSLIKAQNNLNDTDLAENYLAFSKIYLDINKDTSNKYAFLAMGLAEKLDNSLFIYKANHYLASSYNDRGKYALSENFHKTSLKYAEIHGDSDYICDAYLGIGIVNHHKAQYDIALRNYNIFREYNQRVNNHGNICLILANTGQVYSDLGDENKAFEYYKESERIALEQNIPLRILNAKNRIGGWYNDKESHDTAAVYFYEAIKIAKQHNFHLQVGTGYNNIAISQFYKGNVDSSEYLFRKSLEYRQKYSGLTDISDSYLNLGSLYSLTGKHELAVEYYLKSYELANKAEAMTNVKEVFEILAEEYEGKKDFTNAFKYLKLYSNLNDSLKSVSVRESIADKEVLYNLKATQNELESSQKNEKLQAKLKDQANEAKENEESKNDIILWSSIIGGALLSAFLFVLFRANKQKQKDNILLGKQKEELQFQKEEIEEINKDITDSLEYARTLQQAMLEDITQINHIFPENFLLFLPRDIVSGDFYWIHEKENKVFIAAADCTGHGVPGAFVSMLGNDLLNKIVIEKDYNDPGLILAELNKEVQAVFKKENNKVTANDGMDIAFCVIDKTTKNIEFSGAMNPLIIIRNGDILEQKGTKSSIGGYTPLDTEFVTTTIETQNKDSVYIFSDGYQDQFGGVKGKKFMAGKFRKLLLTLPELNYENQKTKLENNLYEWEGNYQRVDDILIIGFQIDK